MDTVGHFLEFRAEGLEPRSLRVCGQVCGDGCEGRTVVFVTDAGRPVVRECCILDEHIEDFEVDFHRDQFTEQGGEFGFGVDVVIHLEVLAELGRPQGFDLAGLGDDLLGTHFEVDRWDVQRGVD